MSTAVTEYRLLFVKLAVISCTFRGITGPFLYYTVTYLGVTIDWVWIGE
jgi:hypothetical protein